MTAQEQAEIDIIDFPAQPGVMQMDDGSAIVGEIMDFKTNKDGTIKYKIKKQ